MATGDCILFLGAYAIRSHSGLILIDLTFSVIDLHLHDGGVGLEVGGIGSGTKSAVLHEANGDAKVRRRVEPGELEKKGKIESINTETLETENFRESKHYDADGWCPLLPVDGG